MKNKKISTLLLAVLLSLGMSQAETTYSVGNQLTVSNINALTGSKTVLLRSSNSYYLGYNGSAAVGETNAATAAANASYRWTLSKTGNNTVTLAVNGHNLGYSKQGQNVSISWPTTATNSNWTIANGILLSVKSGNTTYYLNGGSSSSNLGLSTSSTNWEIYEVTETTTPDPEPEPEPTPDTELNKDGQTEAFDEQLGNWEDQLHLTDLTPTLIGGIYGPDELSYTRTVSNYWANFYLPFPVELSTLSEQVSTIYTIADFAFYNPDKNEISLFLQARDMETETLPAFTPFLAEMATDADGGKTEQDVRFGAAETTEIAPGGNRLTALRVYDYTGGTTATTSQSIAMWAGGTLRETQFQAADGIVSFMGKDATLGNVTGIKAFRAIIRKGTSPSAPAAARQARIVCTTGMSDIVTGVELIDLSTDAADNRVYSIDGRLIGTTDCIDQLPQGIYISNGKKIIR